jgi:hypothetical protein
MLCVGRFNGNQMYFTPDLATNAMQHELCTLNSVHFVEVGESTSDGLHISVINAFCESMHTAIESRSDQTIVVCPAVRDVMTGSDTCLLCGAFLLLCNETSGLESLDHVLSAFKDTLQGYLAARRTAIVDCWTALHRARAIGWLSITYDDDHEPPLDVEMSRHYALASNGGVHVLVPGKLLLFPAPAPLPADQAWIGFK